MSKLTDGLKLHSKATQSGSKPRPAKHPSTPRNRPAATSPPVPYTNHVHAYLESLHLDTGSIPPLDDLKSELRELNAKADAKLAAMGTTPLDPDDADTTPLPTFDRTIKQPWMDSTPEKKCKGPCKRSMTYDHFNRDARFKDDGHSPLCKECEPRLAAAGGSKADLERINHAEPSLGGSFRKRRSNPVKKRAYRMVVAAHSRALRQGVPCDLHNFLPELEQRLSGGVCEMIGMKWDFDTPLAFNTPSLYAVDPALGFVYSNIKVICWGMNVALGTWGPEVLKSAMLELLSRD